jgi:hypothetical protein
MVDAVAANVEAPGRDIVTADVGPSRRAVEPVVGTIAAPVEVTFSPITAPVESLLDAVTAVVEPILGVRPNLRRARQQRQTEPYCTAFHRRPP